MWGSRLLHVVGWEGAGRQQRALGLGGGQGLQGTFPVPLSELSLLCLRPML